MSAFWLAQNLAPAELVARGKAVSAAIVAANGGAPAPRSRCTAILRISARISRRVCSSPRLRFHGSEPVSRGWHRLSGAAGNALNAWFYRGEAHVSIGASTAVFGALGLLVGAEFFARLARAETRSRWQLIVPLGAGFALLAFLGVGEEHRRVDYMAHFWGFTAGLALGAFGTALRVDEAARWWQTAAASSARRCSDRLVARLRRRWSVKLLKS
jgi:hypothetical protein